MNLQGKRGKMRRHVEKIGIFSRRTKKYCETPTQLYTEEIIHIRSRVKIY